MRRNFLNKLISEKGDTLVEVLLATVALSAVLVSIFSISNRATQSNQNAAERTQASNLMQEQAELIKFAYSNSTSEAAELRQSLEDSGVIDTSETDFSQLPCSLAPSVGNAVSLSTVPPFNVESYSVTSASDSEEVKNDGNPDDIFVVWIEAYSPSGANFVDYTVRSCWEGLGTAIPFEGGFVVRVIE